MLSSRNPVAFSILLVFLYGLVTGASAQSTYSHEAIKTAYVFNFLKYITWPNDESLKSIEVGFLGTDAAYHKALLGITSQKIRGKSLVLKKVNEINQLDGFQVVVTSKDQNKRLAKIARILNQQKTLLISDSADNKKLIMLNFTYPDGEHVGFELNRYNIVYEKLKMSPDILVLGGNELDIAELLREMESDLENSQRKLIEQTDRLEQVQKEVSIRERQIEKQSQELTSLQQNVKKSEQRISDQKLQIEGQTQELEDQKSLLESTQTALRKLRSELSQLDAALVNSRSQLENNNQVLSQKQFEISAKESSIKDLSRLIEDNRSLLQEQTARIRDQEQEITLKESDLAEKSVQLEVQGSTIRQQTFILAIAVAVILIILLLVIIIFRGSRAKQKAIMALGAANLRLEEANNMLRETQGQLVESEKMASLGGLVAGVAHEINTPLGVSVTAATHLADSVSRFAQSYESGSLKRSELETLLSDAKESTSMLNRNLQRASELIGNFKQVAVDQTAEDLRQFELRHYLEEVCQSLYPQLKQGGHHVEVSGAENIVMETYPGALAQVITNLIMNSLVHGFDDRRNGNISILINEVAGSATIDYRDDGVGIREDQREKIFEPFYTTRRAQGGTGLGMHICYNLINQTLQGSIICTNAEQGARFFIELPCQVKD